MLARELLLALFYFLKLILPNVVVVVTKLQVVASARMFSKLLLCTLLAYFLLLSFTVERSYADRPLTLDDPGLLMKEKLTNSA
jgi:hypothetical protein